MLVRLSQITDEEPCRWREEEAVEAATLERSELLELGPISWEGEIVPAHPGYRLQGRLEYRQSLACNRCLKPLIDRVDTPVELILLVNPPDPEPGEVRLDAEDLGVLALEDDELDTLPILVEQLHLNIPMTALCRPDCAGLCPRCGADRNLEPDCCEAPADPRWSALGDLRLPGAR